MNEIKLSFNASTPINAYNYTSYIGGVLFAKDMECYPHYLTKHVLMLSNDLFDITCDDMIMYEDNDVFLRNTNIFFNNNENEVKNELISMLNEGFFASITVDEYEISNRFFYQKEHFYHDILVYGYNLEENIFFTAGYDSSNYFNIGYHDIDSIVQSFTKCLIERKSKPHYHFFKKKNDIDCEFNLSEVKQKFQLYIDSKAYNEVSYNGVYGIDAYEKFIQKFRGACMQGQLLRNASYSMLCEHKKLMMDRINYISSHYTSLDDKVLSAFGEIYSEAKKIQMLSLKYQMTRSEKHMIKIIDKVRDMAEKENKLLHKILVEI